ncbi:dipeptidase PepE [Antarcticibacterium flavum]|uniref:Dipeptidase PepE n=1 Tax=Antarcticibacterium flavum TaxID=2058175 RepID=A0A5B7X5L4_9FLAO|nr:MULTISPECIES: dipeptidase PepE [Antarcticibacterium]MCM4160039.1 dipeptidase PepE [Antarcticibacterium sp. W02-3]QCY70375.1 dipeptidase PepE [Antarcticibacterium flavum]
MKNAILASTSTLHGQSYLEYLLPEVKKHFGDAGEVIFIPYARPGGISHDEYTRLVRDTFQPVGIQIKGLHEYKDPVEAIKGASGIFTGGGNTFLLVEKLYRNKVMSVLKETLLAGIPYLGTSAGTNIAGLSMQTTNDMPIIYPPSFHTLGLVPFNINPHYLDPDTNSTHKGETRETRIKEFHTLNTQPVVGLREGSWLEVRADKISLKGPLPARIFKVDEVPFELEPNGSLTHLN